MPTIEDEGMLLFVAAIVAPESIAACCWKFWELAKKDAFIDRTIWSWSKWRIEDMVAINFGNEWCDDSQSISDKGAQN